ncbi:hypothetical protein SAMN05216551_105298 [Chitinasiproducens palmae]|uniref:Uncharacterized protein n=1 Tax=Chitinasiproducens palmae TaxID=1770053 RepID=A0A1H2PPK9_9BURK|nr:hypothetical protein SAMN05216551_105298 [Chitinasiproducens palmae]
MKRPLSLLLIWASIFGLLALVGLMQELDDRAEGITISTRSHSV